MPHPNHGGGPNRQRSATSTTGRGSTAQNVNVTDIVCEGPIRGLVDGTRSVYLDDVAVEDARFSDFTPDSFLNGKISISFLHDSPFFFQFISGMVN